MARARFLSWGMDRESDLYPPIKAFLERQGYLVKGEVGAVDIMATRADEPPVLVELKLRFSLSLFHQAVARLAISDLVYIAVPRPTGKTAKRAIRDNTALCRRLGLGLILVAGNGRVEVPCDPGPYAPRKSRKRQMRLLREFERLSGDPNAGGAPGTASSPPIARMRCAAPPIWPNTVPARAPRSPPPLRSRVRRG